MTIQDHNNAGVTPRQRIERTVVPEHISELLVEYDDIVDERNDFLWRWLYSLFPEIKLSCVPSGADRIVRDAKLLTSLYIVMLDDIAEIEGDARTFQEAAKVPFHYQFPDTTRAGVDTEFVEFTARIWERVEATVEPAPCSEEFRDIFSFDLKQNLNAIEYSHLVNRHLDLATVEETSNYDSYNMMLFTYADLDLMYSPAFDRTELGTLRKIVRRAQRMARIGNWVTTWERELDEDDFNSGVVVSAIENGVVSREQLRRLRDGHSAEDLEDVVTAIHGAEIEAQFLHQWVDRYGEIERFESEIESVDIETLLEGLETVLEYHLASRGLK